MIDPTVLRAPVVEPATPPDPPRTSKRRTAEQIRRRWSRFDASSLGKLGIRISSTAGSVGNTLGSLFGPALTKVRSGLAMISPLGWSALAVTAVAWYGARTLGWIELGYLAMVFAALLIFSALFTIGRLRLGVSLEVEPLRVTVGESAAARLLLHNDSSAPLLPLGVEFPVGQAVARYTTPMLAPGGEHEEMALIPTQRRGVIVVGPVTTQRGDPFGMLRRELMWTEPLEVFVHPKTVALAPFGSGLLRDLEGQTTNEVSMSDLAFHTLREYVPGDDRRYIHWRSSAKASAASGSDTFLVRQFLDTRRSHLALVLDVDPASYADEDEFETAISVAASMAVRALVDEVDLTVLCGELAVVEPDPHNALDVFSRAEQSEATLSVSVEHLTRVSPDVSIVALITGSGAEFAELRKARAMLPVEISMLALQVNTGAQASFTQVADLPIISLGKLQELPKILIDGVVR